MSTKDGWSTSTRILFALGVGVLLVGAWFGGRMSVGGRGPFDLMAEGPHGEGMMHSSHGQSEGAASGEKGASGDEGRSVGTFDGEAGLQRCRAMMGTMAGMHRSMQSMMQRHRGEQAVPGSGDRRSRMGHGMMGGRMGENMDREEMRRLCQTMKATMQDVMHGGTPGDADASAEGNPADERGLEPQTEQWLGQTRGFDQVDDYTGESEVVIDVGAGTGRSHAPAAVRVDPGTTVRWRWTGQAGLHDVAFINADVSTSLRSEQGETVTKTFAEPGEYRYKARRTRRWE